jgi:hypothetical protein
MQRRDTKFCNPAPKPRVKSSCGDCHSKENCNSTEKPHNKCVDPFTNSYGCYAGFAECCRYAFCTSELKSKH